MTASATTTTYRRLTRDADRAMLGGVFAGISRHFGINLCVLRFVGIIAFLAAFPFMFVAYIAAVLLIPAESWRDEYVVERVVRRCRRRVRRRASRRERREAEAAVCREADEEVSKRARELEDRLARIEKKVTSRRYQLDEEFRNL